MLDKFAEGLRKARKKSGVTLQQIAQKSRIDLKFIEAIDKGDFGFLPEPYVKAFIKQYAINVGLDENDTLEKYEDAKEESLLKDQAEENSVVSEQQEQPSEQNKHRKRSVSTAHAKSFRRNFQDNDEDEPTNLFEGLKRNKILLVSVISGIAVILFVIIYFLFLKSSSDIVVAEKPYDEVRKENQRYVKEYKLPEPEKPTSKVDSLTLAIQAADSSWFQIRVDNSMILEFVLYPNTTKIIKAAKGFKMIIGNTGDTRLKLNDKELKLTGKKKEVKYVFIDKSGLKYLQPPKNPDQE